MSNRLDRDLTPAQQSYEESLSDEQSLTTSVTPWREKKGWACAGIIVLGVVIAAGLVLIVIKQSQSTEDITVKEKMHSSLSIGSSHSTHSSSSSVDSSSSIESLTSSLDSSSGSVPVSQLEQLQSLVSKCQKPGDDDECHLLDNLIGDDSLNSISDELEKSIFNITLLFSNTSEHLSNINFHDLMTQLRPQLHVLHQDDPNQSVTNHTSSDPNERSQENEYRKEDGNTGELKSSRYEVSCNLETERRCRDKSACYPVQSYCNFKVDCEDNSDEDDCNCVDRLVDSRKCDSYHDCQNGEDESNCGCGSDFFCAGSRNFGSAECLNISHVCDGKEDCPNGRDEEDCLLLGPRLSLLLPSQSSRRGYLALWRPDHGYLPVHIDNEDLVNNLTEKVCIGLSPGPHVTIRVKRDYIGVVASVGQDWEVELIQGESGVELLMVDCGEIQCGSHISDDIQCDTCSKEDQIEGKIVGGRPSKPDSWPATVAILRDSVLICGATILNSHFVITAAHCFHAYKEGVVYQVRAGMLRRDSQSPWEQYRTVKEVYIHHDYNKRYYHHDVALVRVDIPMSLNRHVATACLPIDQNMSPQPGSTCVASGWGDIKENGPSSEYLKEVEIPILSGTDYVRSYNNATFQIYGGYPRTGKKDACQGDSGGPLYCKSPVSGAWYLGGLVSFGQGCARVGEVGSYVRLTFYLDWVNAVLDGLVDPYSPCWPDPYCPPSATCGGVVCSSGKCVPSKWVCDDMVDCLGGEDTKGCVKLDNGTTVQIVEHIVESEIKSVGFNQVQCRPDEWKCKNIEQCIGRSERCDGVRNCPDWSDETDCRCGDVIIDHRRCDGYIDCEDRSDEIDCQLCVDGWWCQLSNQCIDTQNRCDTVKNCPFGEDEHSCSVLSTSVSKPEDITTPSSTGLLMLNSGSNWSPACVTDMTQEIADTTCQYMGYKAGLQWSTISNMSESCTLLHLSCHEVEVSCGDRPLYQTVDHIMSGPGSWPWHASLLVDGALICGASLLHPSFMLTSMECARLLVGHKGDYITALLGQERRNGLAGLGPHAQVGRVVSMKVVPSSGAVVIMVDNPFYLTEFVTPLCVSSLDIQSDCYITGATGDKWTETMSLGECRETDGSIVCSVPSVIPDDLFSTWSGAVVCPVQGKYYAAGVFTWVGDDTVIVGDSLLQPMSHRWITRIIRYGLLRPPPSPTDNSCSGHRCELGQCIESSKVCDRVWDCSGGDDERGCDYPEVKVRTCAKETGRCLCPDGQAKCTNNLCVEISRVCDGVNDCGDNSDEIIYCD